jgi:hypothetical protein
MDPVLDAGAPLGKFRRFAVLPVRALEASVELALNETHPTA